jgi:hypothetical protein
MTWLDHFACALVDQAAIQSVLAEGSGPAERKPSLAERRAAHGIAPLSVEERAELLDANLTTAAGELGWRDWNDAKIDDSAVLRAHLAAVLRIVGTGEYRTAEDQAVIRAAREAVR